MDPKYEGLPGIAIDQPDCFETSDLPEDDQHALQEEKFESEHIVKTNLNQREAFQQFKGKRLRTDDIDFSDQISMGRRTGYSTGPVIFEMVASGIQEPETPEQKFNRLQYEIKELSEDLDQLKEANSSEDEAKKVMDSLTAADIASLQSQLKQLQVEQILGGVNGTVDHIATQKILDEIVQIRKTGSEKQAKDSGTSGKPSAGPVTYELFYHPEQAKTAQLSKISSLDERLRKMESLLEPQNSKFDAIQSVASRAQLLDLNNLELVEARLSAVLQKLSQVAQKEESIGAEDSEMVKDLYEMVKKWDGFCASLPQIVSRLQSLKLLHEQALQFSQALSQLDSVQQQLSKSLEADSAILKEVRTSMTENMKTIKENCENVENRVKGLGK